MKVDALGLYFTRESILKDCCYGGGERRRCRSTFVGNRDDGFAFSWSGYMYMNKEDWVICGTENHDHGMLVA